MSALCGYGTAQGRGRDVECVCGRESFAVVKVLQYSEPCSSEDDLKLDYQLLLTNQHRPVTVVKASISDG